jgi:putative membrane protein
MIHGGWYGLGGFMGYWGHAWFGPLLGLIIGIGLLIVVVLLIIWLIRRLRFEGRQVTPSTVVDISGPSPKEILQARYARGEIDRKQYQQMLSDLE